MIIGDLLMGGMLGGAFFPGRPGYHYFIEDLTVLHRSIERVLDRPVQRYWVGHGGPLQAKDVRNWYLRKRSHL
jgi:glyoxylase-like metal-dependent hydrolase (beta-lactamase superfamily II)